MNNSRHGRPKALAEVKFAEKANLLKGKSHQEIFTYIYKSNLWGAADSRSGLGSEVDATVELHSEIPKLLKEVKANSVLDIPCGDFGWMSKLDLPIQDYIGGDIVESIVSNLGQNFSGEREGVRYSFEILDIASSELPRVDVVLCRDCLVHFSFESIQKAIQNVKRSGSGYLLATTFTELSSNIDVQDGDWRPQNLEAAPFNFPKPQKIINERCTEVGGAYTDKSLGLWKIAELPAFLV